MARVRDIDHALDLFDGECSRRGYTSATRRRYVHEILYPFAEWLLLRDVRLHELTEEHCKEFLNRWANHASSTRANNTSVINVFCGWLYDEGVLATRIWIKRPKLLRPEELDVTTISSADVLRLFDKAREWDEILCMAVLAYLGPRRNAAAQLRRRDVDLERSTMRFREKGGKTITKPIPHELAAIIAAADEAGVWVFASGDAGRCSHPDAYLIPNRKSGPNSGFGQYVRFDNTPRKKRSNKVVYSIVKRLGEKAGVKVHPHALRAAFAVGYLDTFDGDTYGLQKLMGHARPETTQVYLRRHDDFKAMEKVRGLSWGREPSVSNRGTEMASKAAPDLVGLGEPTSRPSFGSSADMPPAGFEPAFGEDALPDVLRTKLAALRARSSRERA